jgi:hypothetical protein
VARGLSETVHAQHILRAAAALYVVTADGMEWKDSKRRAPGSAIYSSRYVQRMMDPDTVSTGETCRSKFFSVVIRLPALCLTILTTVCIDIHQSGLCNKKYIRRYIGM